MWRDPLDELIEELERAVPPGPKPKFKSIVHEFMAQSEIIDAEPDVIDGDPDYPERGLGLEAPPSTIATAPVVRLAPPARRFDPSAPTRDYSGQSDSDDTED